LRVEFADIFAKIYENGDDVTEQFQTVSNSCLLPQTPKNYIFELFLESKTKDG